MEEASLPPESKLSSSGKKDTGLREHRNSSSTYSYKITNFYKQDEVSLNILAHFKVE